MASKNPLEEHDWGLNNLDFGFDTLGGRSSSTPRRTTQKRIKYKLIFTISGVTQQRNFTNPVKAEAFRDYLSRRPDVEKIIVSRQ